MIGNETITILREVAISHDDPYGLDNTVSAEPRAVPYCLVQWGSMSDANDSRTVEYIQSTSNAIIYMPANTDILATDTVLVRGVKYSVNGEPVLWKAPQGFRTRPRLIVQVERETR